MTTPTMNLRGDANGGLASAVKASFDLAWRGESRASAYVAALQGMSGQRYRAFMQDLIRRIPEARYLEVGCWMGSTLCSAVDGNDVTALAVDNWSEFGGPSAAFFKNVGGADIGRARVNVLNADFRKVSWGSVGLFNVYLFDGPHSYEDQYDGIEKALPALDDEFVFVVDDWNWPDVRSGTQRAIEDIGLNIRYQIEIRSTLNDIHPGDQGLPTNENSDWHNGYYIAVLKKQSFG